MTHGNNQNGKNLVIEVANSSVISDSIPPQPGPVADQWLSELPRVFAPLQSFSKVFQNPSADLWVQPAQIR